MNELLAGALSQGLGYGLFVALLYYTLKKQDERDKKSEARETKYQEIIADLTKQCSTVEKVEKDVTEIKTYIFNVKEE